MEKKFKECEKGDDITPFDGNYINVSFGTALGKKLIMYQNRYRLPESDPSGLTMLYWTAAALFPVCLATLENLQKKIFIRNFYPAKKTGVSKKIPDLILRG